MELLKGRRLQGDSWNDSAKGTITRMTWFGPILSSLASPQAGLAGSRRASQLSQNWFLPAELQSQWDAMERKTAENKTTESTSILLLLIHWAIFSLAARQAHAGRGILSLAPEVKHVRIKRLAPDQHENIKCWNNICQTWKLIAHASFDNDCWNRKDEYHTLVIGR